MSNLLIGVVAGVSDQGLDTALRGSPLQTIIYL